MSPFRNKRGQRGRFRPALETLEDRSVPAGNVFAAINGGTLVLTGDGAGNAVKVQGNTRGTLDVIALDADTVINNQPGQVTFVGFSGHIIANMGDGHDALVIDRVGVHGGINIDMGNGDDMLALVLTTINGDANIAMGLGNELVMFGCGEVKGNAYVNVGPGNSQVNLLGAHFSRGSYFHAGAGVSSVGIVDVKFKRAPVFIGFQQRVPATLPRAVNDSSTVASGGAVSVNVADNDIANQGTIDRGSVVITQQPLHGTATVSGDGSVSYTNDGSSFADDFFLYTIKNSRGAFSNEGRVALSITGIAGPSVNVTSSAGTITRNTPIPFTATFSDDVTGFTQTDITVTNGTIASFATTSGRVYTFNVNPTANGAVTVSIPPNAGQSAAGTGNTASPLFSITFDNTPPAITVNSQTTNDQTPTITGTVSEAGSTVSVTVNNQTVNATVSGTTWSATLTTALAEGTFAVQATATDAAGNSATTNAGSGLVIDLTPPTVAITSTATSPTGLTSIPIRIEFSENVNNFVAGDITVGNGTLGNFVQVDAKTYTANIAPTNNGAVTANVGAGVATDIAGNANTAAPQFSITFDNTIPGVNITSTVTGPTKLASVPITMTFTENVTGFEASDITVNGGAISNFAATTDTRIFTATLTPTADGVVTVNIAANVAVDTDNKGNSAATPFTIRFDTTAPVPTITSSATSPTRLTPIPITVTFSEDVTGFTAADITVSNGSLGSFAATDDPKIYTASITPTAAGVVTVNIAAGVATDAAANNSAAATPFSITFDNTSPTVNITSSALSPTGVSPIPITVTFSENVTGFEAGDITVGNGTLGGLTPASGSTYNASITPTGPGVVTVNVAAGAVTDTAGNASAAAPQFSITFSESGAPTLARALSDFSNPEGAPNNIIPLAGTFDDDGITNSSITMKAMKGTTPLDLNIELFDRAAPLTVANFFNYFDRYQSNGGTIFHRLHLQTGLEVIQGGGYTFNDATNTISSHIATDAPIRNEFSPDRLDVRGTIAMAKLGDDPNSATSEFFFNLDDANANTLNGTNNGGFVVFGKLVGAADLAAIDSLAAVPIGSAPGFNELPLVDGTTVDENNIERIPQIIVNNRDNNLTYSATSSNPAAVTVSLSGFQNNTLTLDYQAIGTSVITVTVTDRDGLTASTTFDVTVT
jgi:cyclophilin family peptidyl-prolyl cis-trans isomerase